MLKKLLSLLTLTALLVPSLAFAQEIIIESDLNDTGSFNVKDILSTQTEDGDTQGEHYFTDGDTPIIVFILDVVNFITRLIGIVAMILIIIGGLLMIVSEGDENRLQKGKGVLESAIIGLVISMFSYIIVRFVQSLFYLQT